MNYYRHGKRGKDGQLYFYEEELTRADAKWEKENIDRGIKASEQQNKALVNSLEQKMEEQAHKIEQLNSIIESNAKEQQQALKDFQDERRSHEEKMRILKLFDDIGINQDLFDNFMNYIFKVSTVSSCSEEMEKCNKLTREKAIVEAKIKYIDVQKKKIGSWEEIKQEVKKKEPVAPYYVMNNNGLFKQNFDDEEIKLMDKIYKQQSLFLNKTLNKILIFIFFVIFLIKSSTLVILIAVLVLIYVVKKKIRNNLIREIENAIDTCNEIVIDKEKQLESLRKLEDIEKDYSEVMTKIREIEREPIERHWADFEKFRLCNYNSKIEKLLLDLDIPAKCKANGIKFVSITKSNAKYTGEIDTYVSHFQNLLN